MEEEGGLGTEKIEIAIFIWTRSFLQLGASAERIGGFLLCPIFSVHFLHLQVDFMCHKPVTLAALYELDILIYSWPGFTELKASPRSQSQE